MSTIVSAAERARDPHGTKRRQAIEKQTKDEKARIEEECNRLIKEAEAIAKPEKARVIEQYETKIREAEKTKKIELGRVMDECLRKQSQAGKWKGLEIQKLYSRRKNALREAAEAWENDRKAAGVDRGDAVVLFCIEKSDLRMTLDKHHVVFIPVTALPVVYTFVNDLIKMVKRFDPESLQADQHGWYIDFGGSEQGKDCASACFDHLKGSNFNHYELKLELIGLGFTVIKSWPQEAPAALLIVSQTSSPDAEPASSHAVTSPTAQLPQFEIDLKDPQILNEFKEFLKAKYPKRYGNSSPENEDDGEVEASKGYLEHKQKAAKSEDDDTIKGSSKKSKGGKPVVIHDLTSDTE